jgi:hypothetical protein
MRSSARSLPSIPTVRVMPSSDWGLDQITRVLG